MIQYWMFLLCFSRRKGQSKGGRRSAKLTWNKLTASEQAIFVLAHWLLQNILLRSLVTAKNTPSSLKRCAAKSMVWWLVDSLLSAKRDTPESALAKVRSSQVCFKTAYNDALVVLLRIKKHFFWYFRVNTYQQPGGSIRDPFI